MASFTKRGNYRRVRIRTKAQDLISRTFDTKAQAKVWARSIENEMDRSEAEHTTLMEYTPSLGTTA